MASYANGEQTKAALIQAAKELFGKNGYTSTRCSDISQQAGTNPGLIHYYFKTKGNIALIVYGDILNQIVNTVSSIFADETVFVRRAIEYRIFWRLISQSDAYRRFICDIIPERISIKMSRDIWFDYMESMNQELPHPLSEDFLCLMVKCSTAVQNELVLEYADPDNQLTFEELSATDLRVFFQLLSLTPKEINAYMERSESLIKQLSISISLDFHVCIIKLY